MSPEETKAAVRAAIRDTLDDIFDKEMLAKMEKHGIIAQGLGFVTHCRADLYTAVETALGITEDEEL